MTLLDRIIAAEGPDSDLDFEILCFVDPRAVKTGPMHNDPRYTASIDAALTLLPEGWGYQIHCPSLIEPDNLPSARVWDRLATTTQESAATPALALLAAIMKIGDL